MEAKQNKTKLKNSTTKIGNFMNISIRHDLHTSNNNNKFNDDDDNNNNT